MFVIISTIKSLSWTPLYDRSYFQETTSYLHKDFAVVEISKYIKCQQIIVPLIVDRKCEHFGNELKKVQCQETKWLVQKCSEDFFCGKTNESN